MKFSSKEVKDKQKKVKSPKQKAAARKRLSIIRWILVVLLAIVLIIGCTGLGVVVGIAKSTPSLDSINVVPTKYPTKVLDSDGNEVIQLNAAGAKRAEATLDEIPDNLKYAFIDIEDERFLEHNGIDLTGILRAAYQTIFEGSSQGASTITQQLIKNNVFETGGFERSTGSLIRRKIQEQILALGIEKEMSKDEILINYLNTINLGGGNYGVKTAAKYYFGKEVSDLNLTECAVIAAITQNPSANNPARFPEKNEKRMHSVLKNMLENGHITQAEYDEAMADPVYERIDQNAISTGNSLYSYFVDALIEDLIEDLQTKAGYTYAQAYNAIYTGGLTVYSTQNTAVQNIVDVSINSPGNWPGEITYDISWDMTVKHKDGTVDYLNQNDIRNWEEDVMGNYNNYNNTGEQWEYKHNYGTTEEADAVIAQYKEWYLQEGDEITYESVYYIDEPQMSFTVMDYTNGHVLAILGGRGDKQTSLSLNRATNVARQPGSCFKIVASFAPALDAGGYTLATAVDDSPFYYGNSGRAVNNWWGAYYRGLSTIREGVRDSMNVVAVKTMYDIGTDLGIQYLKEFGFTTIDEEGDNHVATALGGITNGIINLEINAAYSAIANKGVYIEPILYTKVVGMDGTVIIENVPETHRVLKETTAFLMTSAMQDVVTGGTGTPAGIWDTPVAGKTGTTTDSKDLWFVGYVPNGLCAAIWTGYDSQLEIWTNQAYHESMYSLIMSQVVQVTGRAGGSFDVYGDITQAAVCKKSGKLPNENCSNDPAGSQIITEYFAAGTVPSAGCDCHTSMTVCKESHQLVGEYCPETEVVVFRVRPQDVTGGAAKGTTVDSAYEPPKETCKIHTKEWKEEEEKKEKESKSKKKETTTEETDEDDDTIVIPVR